MEFCHKINSKQLDKYISLFIRWVEKDQELISISDARSFLWFLIEKKKSQSMITAYCNAINLYFESKNKTKCSKEEDTLKRRAPKITILAPSSGRHDKIRAQSLYTK